MDTGLSTMAEAPFRNGPRRHLYVCKFGQKCSSGQALHRVCGGCNPKIQVVRTVELDEIDPELVGKVAEVIVCPLVQAAFDLIEASA